ncbi:isoleucine-tRNA ligase [Micractinium conductrix]|uniref:isoleucine--tRNA ligase n=1 Tax=Micractinium conductrix TaxID=554055 RepID=A0A2P6V967_9CHLO|nr:isoleucine-tRNA ligase [Micractinium conductrix]|eukprot:PSC70632.1 isoleucine-tRNA ligase [Micractinium conductrix]
MLSSLRLGTPAALWAARHGLAARPAAVSRVPLRCLAAKGGRKKDAEESVYSKTVNLPQTAFDMRANSVVREPQLQQFWEDNKVYEQLSRSNPGPAFTLHDGPPYANGDLHIGHALNKILKDFINRYQLLQGRKAKFVPGWDTHGLPIELKVLQSMKEDERRSLTPLQLREKAAQFALKTVDAQREQFKRYGVWADWDAPYVTLDPAYEAAQLRVFGQMVLNGHIYRGRKPVHWSPSSRTALAEAELEYPEGHTSRSIYVAMPLKALGPVVPEAAAAALEGAAFGIWTTTPWTIPANLAVAVNGELAYAVVEIEGDAPEGWKARRLVVAADLADQLAEKFGLQLRTLCTLKGSELEGCTYAHPLFDRVSPVVIGGDYITTESGTGLVHTAPGHGQEDYQVGLKYGLPLLSPVDDAGEFTEEAGPFAGLQVQGAGNEAVVQALTAAGALLKEESYAHKYPYDWRTKKPTIFRATDQWFASVEGFRGAALEAIEGVSWIPATGQNRITSMTEGRSDWCISRQRKWGVPIPVFYYEDSGEPLLTEETIEYVTQVVAQHGSDAWWRMEIADLLPEHLRGEAPKLRRGEDTMDVWFDSGSSWAGVLGGDEALNYPADLYLEGSDQHRGWFQSSLLTSVAANGHAPYNQVLTHGFVLDDKGMKMSKSLGNVIDPRMVIGGGKDAKKDPPYGADVLRLWVASVDYSSDVLIGGRILSQVADVYRKVRFTLRYLLGNLSDYDPAAHAVPHTELAAADRYILARFAALVDECSAAYGSYQFSKVYQALQRFTVLDLSNFYLDVAKDRLYINGSSAADRRACQTTLAALLEGMLPLIAPLLPHMAEDAWQNLPYARQEQSVFQAGWAGVPDEWRQLSEEDSAAWRSVLGIRAELNQLLEKARADKALGASLEAKVKVHVANQALRGRLQALQAAPNGMDPLRYLFIVSQAELADSPAGAAEGAAYSASAELDEGGGAVTLGVARADGAKCKRCWNYSTHVGSDAKHPELCERCLPVINEMGFEAPAPVAAVSA